MTAPGSDTQDAMSALERLYARNVITLEEATTAARLITGNPEAPFPPPAKPSRAANPSAAGVAEPAQAAPPGEP